MAEITSGTQLASRYTLVKKLGAGRGSETWLADDRLTRARVALKRLSSADGDAARLQKEWQLGIRLMHAHIVRAFEFHDDPDGAFFTQQYIEGPDLSVLAGGDWQEVLPPLMLLAQALEYLHGHDVVHRDIKAANVLLDGNGAPYLIDFGIAASGGERVGGGTLIAASPEQLDGAPPTPADDIFALGALCYELLAGRSPWPPTETEAAIRAAAAPALRETAAHSVPEDVEALVHAMLAKDPAERPDAASVVERLRAAGVSPGPAPARYVAGVRGIGDEVIESGAVARRAVRPAEAAVPADEGAGLSPRTVAAAFGLLLVVLLGVIFLLPKTVDDAARTTDETAAPDSSAAPEQQAAPAPTRDERVVARQDAEAVLGRLLARTRTLEGRAVERWGGLAWKRARDAYAAGDEAYLAADYSSAKTEYEAALEHLDPLLDQVDDVFARTLADAEAALANGEAAEALRLYELAVAISPSHGPARRGLERARNLDQVLALTDQGFAHERELALDAARQSFARAVEIDPQWQPAVDGLARVESMLRQMQFDARMSEGLAALADGDLLSARASFERAAELFPGSSEPADGLLQVDNALRLEQIESLQRRAAALEAAERWQDAIDTYDEALALDPNLAFAQQGRARATRMQALYAQLEAWVAEPDTLSSPRTMQLATQTIVDVTRLPTIGPRLEGLRDDVSRLLRRAATPLTVQLVSDNLTDVSIYKVGKLGTFETTEVTLRPGTYVAVGSRPGYRDVRIEFRVAPEEELGPVIVRCEERI